MIYVLYLCNFHAVWLYKIILLDVRQTNSRNKRWLILANPASGSGKAVNIFKERVHPMMAEAAIDYELIVTGQFDN